MHGERRVWHPMVGFSTAERDALLLKRGVTPQYPRSLECHPCVNNTAGEVAGLSAEDRDKVARLEKETGAAFFQRGWGSHPGIQEQVIWLKENPPAPQPFHRDNFYLGCGEQFGCGL